MSTSADKKIQSLFTSAQIARGAGISRQAVHQALSGITPADQAIMSGNMVKVFAVDQIPAGLLAKLEARAKAERWRSVGALLAGAEAKWEPAVALNECAKPAVDKACSLREAMLKPLAMWNDAQAQRQAWTGAEIEAAGLEEYKKAFRHAVTAEWWWKLFDRTLARARAGWDIARAEIYLDEQPALKAETAETAGPVAAAEADKDGPMGGLALVIGAIPNPKEIANDVVEKVWVAAIKAYGALVDSGTPERRAKEIIHDFLLAGAPGLAASREALRKAFQRRLDDPEAVRDRRAEANKQRNQAPLSDDEFKFLLWKSAQLENRRLAWRKFLASDQASAATKQRYNPRWLPKAIEDRLKPHQGSIERHIRGPQAAKMGGAFIERDPDSIASGDIDQSDDKTLDLIWWDETPDGLWVGQGQLLPWMDFRSWMIHDAMLITDKGYTGFDIRNSHVNKMRRCGVPRKAIWVERGIWEKSRVFTGPKNEVVLDESATGYGRLGVEIRHATTPRGKLIERVFGDLSAHMQDWRGYAGRNQHVDKFERIQKAIQLCRSGRAHPSEFFMHKGEVVAKLKALFEELNNTPKQGKYHEGRTPAQVYQDCFTTPLTMIPDELFHFFMSNKEIKTVGRNGVLIRYGKREFRYKNHPELGRWLGQNVIVRFHHDHPEFARITDMNDEHPIEVPLEPLRHADDPADAAAGAEACANMNRFHRELFVELKNKFEPEFQARQFRKVVADGAARQAGAEMQRMVTAGQEAKKEGEKLQRKAHRAFGRLGMAVNAQRLKPERIAAAERLSRLLHEDEPTESAAENTGGNQQ